MNCSSWRWTTRGTRRTRALPPAPAVLRRVRNVCRPRGGPPGSGARGGGGAPGGQPRGLSGARAAQAVAQAQGRCDHARAGAVGGRRRDGAAQRARGSVRVGAAQPGAQPLNHFTEQRAQPAELPPRRAAPAAWAGVPPHRVGEHGLLRERIAGRPVSPITQRLTNVKTKHITTFKAPRPLTPPARGCSAWRCRRRPCRRPRLGSERQLPSSRHAPAPPGRAHEDTHEASQSSGDVRGVMLRRPPATRAVEMRCNALARAATHRP